MTVEIKCLGNNRWEFTLLPENNTYLLTTELMVGETGDLLTYGRHRLWQIEQFTPNLLLETDVLLSYSGNDILDSIRSLHFKMYYWVDEPTTEARLNLIGILNKMYGALSVGTRDIIKWKDVPSYSMEWDSDGYSVYLRRTLVDGQFESTWEYFTPDDGPWNAKNVTVIKSNTEEPPVTFAEIISQRGWVIAI